MPEEQDDSPRPEGERKLVTALFADLKGSTALMEELDPEAARPIAPPPLRIMSDAVQRYEGYVARTTGDGIFALFGAPTPTHSSMATSIHAGIYWEPMHIVRAGPGHSMSGNGRPAPNARLDTRETSRSRLQIVRPKLT